MQMSASMLPDYSGGNLVNLMQSVASACGQRETRYPPLTALPAARLSEARHLVFLVIDGLGQQTLDEALFCPNLQRHQITTLNSVFPSTTASAITTFMTGLAPAQHGLTGWHMYLDEIDQTLAILPLTPRNEAARRRPEDLPPMLFDTPTLFQQLDRDCWVLSPEKIVDTPFNIWHARGATRVAYNGLPEMFTQLTRLLNEAQAPRFIYAYYPDLDTVSHRFGTRSEQARHTLAAVDTAFVDFVDGAQGRDAWLLVTADHGFIDSPPERVISLDDHPSLAALLTRPLCGERRAAYSYVAPAKHAALAAYVEQHLAHCTDLRRSAELIDAGWFGPPPFHPRLAARVGDFTLVMKDHWTIKDWLPGEKRYRMLGVHGGISRDEMHVPLVALQV